MIFNFYLEELRNDFFFLLLLYINLGCEWFYLGDFVLL